MNGVTILFVIKVNINLYIFELLNLFVEKEWYYFGNNVKVKKGKFKGNNREKKYFFYLKTIFVFINMNRS